MLTCGTCGQTFATKGEKRRHKLAGCQAATAFQADTDENAHAGFPGHRHITPEIKARADAEWAAMDWRGRLPKGWTWPVAERIEG